MNKQFKASEVRRAAECPYVLSRNNDMLRAFADRLEADEKAVPVYQHRNKNGPVLRWFDCSAEDFELMEHNDYDKDHFDRRVLYTHPAPADTERLAEALLWIMRAAENAKEPCGNDPESPAAIRNGVLASISSAAAQGLGIVQGPRLAAHSAQARPAASVPTMRFFIGGPRACAYVDKFEHVEAVITALCDCTGDDRDDYTSTDLLASERVR